MCARQDLAQNVRNGLPACIEPEQTKPPQYSDIGHGFFTFLETGSSLARNNFFFRIMLYYTSYVIVISLYKTTNGYRFYRVRIFFRQQKLNISISFTDTRSQVRDLLDPSSVVRDFCVHPWHYSAILTERDDTVNGVFTCQRASRITVTRILPTRSVTKMVILLNEHSIFWSFLYACLVRCVANADSHQHIANFRLGEKSFQRLIIYLEIQTRGKFRIFENWKFDRSFLELENSNWKRSLKFIIASLKSINR